MPFNIGTEKIDNQAVLGLSGVNNSLAYRVHEIERHFHNSEQWYGLTANTLARKSLTPIVVVGGNDDWGTELQLHDGATIESGDSVKKMDLHGISVIAMSTANRATILELYYGTQGTGVAATMEIATDTITKTAHGLTDGTKVMLSSIVTTTGVNAYTTYYVVGKTDDTFQVSLTSGGAAIDLATGDGTCEYHVLTQTLLTEKLLSAAATNADAIPYVLLSPRVACNNRVWARAKAAGGTCDVSFYLGLHTYSA